MAREVIRIPILKTYRLNCFVYGVELALDIRASQRTFVLLPFLFDSGSQFTTISLPMARQHGIPISPTLPVTVQGTTGSGQGFLSPMCFSFPALPQWQFETQCGFTPYPLKRSLFSFSDVVPHFTLRTTLPTAAYPNGSLMLRLRPNHGGKRRR